MFGNVYLNGLLRRRRARKLSWRRSNRSCWSSLWLSNVTMLAWTGIPICHKKKTKTEIKLCMDTKCLGSNNLLWVVWGAGEYPKSGTCWRLLLWLALCCGGESSSAVKLGGWRSLDWLNLTHSSTVSFHFLQREKWIRIQKSVRGEEGFRVWWW